MRSLQALVLGAAVGAAPVPCQAPTQPVRHLVEVVTTGPAQMQRLLALDLDLAGCTRPLPAQRRVEVIAYDRDLAALTAAGIPFRVLVRDLAGYHAAQAARFPVANVDDPTPPVGQGAMGGHYTLQQMEAILDALHAQYPQLCSPKVSIGTSVEGRSLWLVKISDNVGVDENEPEVLYDALHHAREPLSMATTLLFMDELLAGYGSDPLATFLVNERELFFVPCVNPDGYEYNRQTNPGGGGMWRKNRRDNGDGTFGVDLNRNYATAWSAPNGGSSSSPGSDTYRGPAPFSEPETQALEAFAQSRQFVQVFSTHTYTDVLLRPFGWQVAEPANVADYQTLGDWFVQENGIAHGSVASLLYIASGSAVDHHHAVRGAYAWTAELGRSNEGAFWPAGPTIAAIARRHQPMFWKVALGAGAALAIDAVAVTEGPGGNGNNQVEPGEQGRIVVTVRNLGVAATTATAGLLTLTSGVTLGVGSAPLGNLAGLSTQSNAAAPLTFAIPPGFAGPAVRLRVRVTGDGRQTEQDVTLALVPPRLCVADDFERDRGFVRGPGGTATTGLWERAAPQATSSGGNPIQPGFQTTAGGALCWVTDARAGTSAGTWDVDGGHTDLLSPVLDLRHLATAEVAFDLWYAESVGDDELQVSVSRDGGGSWSPLHGRMTSTGAWVRLRLDLGAPLTDRMQLRVRAQDQNPSLVEALVDGFELHGVAADGAATLLGSGALGSELRLGLNAVAGTLLFPLGALARGAGVTFPGVQGALLLDPATLVVLPARVADAGGHAGLDLALPAQPGLVGLQVHFQTLRALAGGAAFGDHAVAATLR